MMKNILVIGACGQIGSELTMALRQKYGNDHVIATDIREGGAELMNSGPFEILDAKDNEAIETMLIRHNIGDVYLMAAMLSVIAEKHPLRAWELNMNSLFNVLNLAREKKIRRVFWPSSIAAFGLNTPHDHTPQITVMDPNTVYGISKLTGERWCAYYHKRYGVDVRSVRFPGLISYKTPPGGGTTDYAIDIFHKALSDARYECFLKADTALPMMYMDDAIQSILCLMATEEENLTIHSSYNLGGISCTPRALAKAIQNHISDFEITYNPDFRQEIADSWPNSIDDSQAARDWGWKSTFDLDDIVEVMLNNLPKS